MSDLRYTLLTDGSSDRVLVPLLTWLLREKNVRAAIQPQWAELRGLPNPPRDLYGRILTSIELYPCDLLFVHRDAEREPSEERVREIEDALLRGTSQGQAIPPAVCVVPVRMQEAWLLFDEAAIRQAAGNPTGRQGLGLPRVTSSEALPDPKEMLHGALRAASGLSGRRIHTFNARQAALRLADLIDDFAPLRALPAFQRLEADLGQLLVRHGLVP